MFSLHCVKLLTIKYAFYNKTYFSYLDSFRISCSRLGRSNFWRGIEFANRLIHFLHCHFSFALLRSSLMCLRGSRSSLRHPGYVDMSVVNLGTVEVRLGHQWGLAPFTSEQSYTLSLMYSTTYLTYWHNCLTIVCFPWCFLLLVFYGVIVWCIIIVIVYNKNA